MNRSLLLLLGGVFVLFSCASEAVNKNEISEAHKQLLGSWTERSGADSTHWSFKLREVEWSGFTHYYTISGDSLVISGLIYRILQQSENKTQILKPNGVAVVLTRNAE